MNVRSDKGWTRYVVLEEDFGSYRRGNLSLIVSWRSDTGLSGDS